MLFGQVRANVCHLVWLAFHQFQRNDVNKRLNALGVIFNMQVKVIHLADLLWLGNANIPYLSHCLITQNLVDSIPN